MKVIKDNVKEKIQVDYVESCIPPLLSGTYTLSVTQNVEELGNSTTETRTFCIEGPRFNLSEPDIESVYPPAGMKGSFGLSLPHVVFDRKTLPWERSPLKKKDLTPDKADAGPRMETPWIALLLLCGDEILEVKTDSAHQAFSSHPINVYLPEPDTEIPDKDEVCHYIDMDKQLFLNVMPTPGELPYLCHTRKVDTALQCVGEKLQPDLHSVLIGNRVPQTSDDGVKNRAYIVSLENYIKDGKYVIDGEYARLTVLYSWNFFSVTERHHIKDMFTHLSTGNLTYPCETEDEPARSIIAHGFVPVEHKIRNGSRTVSFYRGPFAPLKIENAGYTCNNADGLYKYDPSIGMFDVSYAAAWQEGRMLTLNSKVIAKKLMRMRTHNLRRLYQASAFRDLEIKLANISRVKREEPRTGNTLLDVLNENSKGLQSILKISPSSTEKG